MAKLTLTANPTFKAKVAIPVAGGPAVAVEMTFRHRTRTEIEAFMASRADKSDADSFMEMVTGWELTDEFSRAAVEQLLESYMGAGVAAYRTYIDEIVKVKLGN